MAEQRQAVKKQMKQNKDSLNKRGNTISSLTTSVSELESASNDFATAAQALNTRKRSSAIKKSSDINGSTPTQKNRSFLDRIFSDKKNKQANGLTMAQTNEDKGQKRQKNQNNLTMLPSSVGGNSSKFNVEKNPVSPLLIKGLEEIDYGDRETNELLNQNYSIPSTLDDAITKNSDSNNNNKVATAPLTATQVKPAAEIIFPLSVLPNKSRDLFTYVGLEKKINNYKDVKAVILKYLDKNIERIDERCNQSKKSDSFNQIKAEIASKDSLTRNEAVKYLTIIRTVAKKHQANFFLFRLFKPTSLKYFDKKFGACVRETSEKLNFNR